MHGLNRLERKFIGFGDAYASHPLDYHIGRLTTISITLRLTMFTDHLNDEAALSPVIPILYIDFASVDRSIPALCICLTPFKHGQQSLLSIILVCSGIGSRIA